MTTRLVPALIVLLVVRAAVAATPPRIAVATPPALERPLCAELARLGFAPIAVPTPPGPPHPRALEAAAARADATAAIQIVPTKAGAEVWLADRATGKMVFRDVVDPGATDSATGTVFVLRAVELLRASLLEIASPRPAPVVAAPAASAAAAPEAPRAWLSAGPAALWAPGGFPPLVQAKLEAAVRWRARLAPTLALALPTFASRVSHDEGFALVSARAATAALHLRPSRAARVAPSVGVGVGALWVRAEGVARSDFSAETRDAVVPIAFADAGVVVALGGRTRLVLAVQAGASSRKAALRFVGRTIATWSAPFVGASLGLGVGF